MKNPFTAKLRAQVAALQKDLTAARAERDDYKAKFEGVQPTIEEKASVLAIEKIASTGTLGPIATGEGKTAAGSAPRTKMEFLERYEKLDGEEAGAFVDKHGHLLDE